MDLVFVQETNQGSRSKKPCGRVKCAVLLSSQSEIESNEQSININKKSGFIQISPTREGPWTTVRLNYAAPSACWRLGDDVVASVVSVINGNRYVTVRSLVSVRNDTSFVLDLCLKLRANNGMMLQDDTTREIQIHDAELKTDEFFETEKYEPANGWVGCGIEPNLDMADGGRSHQVCHLLNDLLESFYVQFLNLWVILLVGYGIVEAC